MADGVTSNHGVERTAQGLEAFRTVALTAGNIPPTFPKHQQALCQAAEKDTRHAWPCLEVLWIEPAERHQRFHYNRITTGLGVYTEQV